MTFFIQQKVSITPEYIISGQNHTADFESRQIQTDLSQVEFYPNLDLLISQICHLTANYMAWKWYPQCLKVDAPFSLIERTLKNIIVQKITLILTPHDKVSSGTGCSCKWP